MKYLEKDFSNELKENIKTIEEELSDLVEKLKNEYKLALEQGGLDVDAAIDRTRSDPFTPGYSSALIIGIASEEDDQLELYQIPIWECQRYFLGIPISIKLPGSKIVGDLSDSSIEELKEEVNDHILEHLGTAAE